MHNFEQSPDPIEEENRRSLEDEEFRDEIREEFADELEYLPLEGLDLASDLPDKVRNGEKAGWSTEAREALLEAASEFGLGREDMERLEDIFLQKEDEDL